jgi:hypothetical protein
MICRESLQVASDTWVRPGVGDMGWSRETVLGDRVLRVMLSRSGAFRPSLDPACEPVESFRLSGRRFRVIVERRPGWEELSDEQRDVRLRETT